LGQLSTAAETIERGVRAQDATGLGEAVMMFRTLAELRFSQLDLDLLKRCDELSKLRGALQRLLLGTEPRVLTEMVA
jgi:hypothetical protein